jgi:hypothetical protein
MTLATCICCWKHVQQDLTVQQAALPPTYLNTPIVNTFTPPEAGGFQVKLQQKAYEHQYADV